MLNILLLGVPILKHITVLTFGSLESSSEMPCIRRLFVALCHFVFSVCRRKKTQTCENNSKKVDFFSSIIQSKYQAFNVV